MSKLHDKKDALGHRMKEYYEEIPKLKLMRRTPVAIRIDGKAFHTFTKGMDKPFDDILIKAMQNTMLLLCQNIQGCVFGYSQSDEITLILIDYQKLNSDGWFGYEVQKMCSIAASMATLYFDREFSGLVQERLYDLCNKSDGKETNIGDELEYDHIYGTHFQKLHKAMFDARCFNIPKEEVANLLYWRQQDAIRNSILSVGQAYFTHKELMNKSCKNILEMLNAINIDWHSLPTTQQRGSCCIKVDNLKARGRKMWEIDNEIPLFLGQSRQYIEQFIEIGE